jgi:CheY-like chemotaxis protein
MFNNLKLSTLLFLGFGLLVSILVVTSALSYQALNSTGDGFKEYRLLARDTNLAGRLQANMLFARLYVKDFFNTGSSVSVSNYQSRLEKLNQFLSEAKVEIQQKNRAQKIAIIDDSINDYIRNFDLIIAFKKERDHLVFDNLDPAGLKMRTKLTAIMKSAFNDKDTVAAYYAGRIQEHVLLARLYANKFLTTNALNSAQRVEKEIGVEIDSIVNTLDEQLDNPNRRSLFKEFIQAKVEYQQHFTAIKKLIFQRNRIISEQLDVIGPIISSAAEDVKLSVKNDQDLLGPTQQERNDEYLILIEMFSLVGILFSIGLALFISKKIRNPIGGEPIEIMNITQQVAKGKTDINFESKNELTGIFSALKEMVGTLNLRVELAQEIAKGNWDVQVELLSKEDTFGLALQKMLSQLKDRNDKLLQESQEKSAVLADIETQNWLKTQVGEVNDIVQGVNDLQQVTQAVIQLLATSLSAGHGVFYILNENTHQDEESSLQLLGSYAFSERKSINNQIMLGEGLVGQCALEKKVILLSQVPEQYVQISSALGKHDALNVIAVPIVYENKCLGAFELASFIEFSAIQQDFLRQVGKNLGVVINSVLARQRIDTLLFDTKKQTSLLQEQQEELKSANENLVEQTQQLQVSEAELKQQSEELRVSNEELALRQKDLQAQKDKISASEQELSIKAKELMIASKYKSEFLANMSHELRTPLNSLLLLAKGLADNNSGHLDETEVEDANIIYDGGQSLLTLINDILDLSKVEAGKLNIHIEAVPLELIKSKLLQLFTPLAKNKNLQLEMTIANDLPDKINTDSQRLEQILRNLLSNAIKFTEMGSVTVNVTIPSEDNSFRHPEINSGNCLAIAVTDTGIGISEEKMQAIFEAFQQEDGSTSRKYGGTGLGLTIARELSHLLGGEIQLSSQIGKGSCFTLFIPLTLTEQTPVSVLPLKNKDLPDIMANIATNISTNTNTNTNTPVLEHQLSPSSGVIDQTLNIFIEDDRFNLTQGEKTLLIIDDDKIFAKILRDYARKTGYKCLVAGDGRSGIYLAQQYQPNGIILDLMLPDIDGHQVLDQLKSNSKTQHIPVEIISAHSENRSEALAGGAIGLQTKPVSREQLQQVLSEIENLSKAKIRQLLVVEDNDHHRKATQNLLENIGLKVTSVDEGKQACQEILTGKYDCVILDIDLPDISGFDVLKQINDAEMRPLPAIIVYTGKELNDQEHALLEQYNSTIVIKGTGSAERLLDDISLFLHNIEQKYSKKMTAKDKEAMRLLHDEEAILQGRKILLTDDDMRNTYALSKQLIDIGCDVEMANNGQEALDLLNEHDDFELILMDTMMPIVDGNEATRKIRQMTHYKNIPIIALTAKTMPEDRELALQAGASEYLTKPVDFEKLVSILRIWLFKTN